MRVWPCGAVITGPRVAHMDGEDRLDVSVCIDEFHIKQGEGRSNRRRDDKALLRFIPYLENHPARWRWRKLELEPHRVLRRVRGRQLHIDEAVPRHYQLGPGGIGGRRGGGKLVALREFVGVHVGALGQVDEQARPLPCGGGAREREAEGDLAVQACAWRYVVSRERASVSVPNRLQTDIIARK